MTEPIEAGLTDEECEQINAIMDGCKCSLCGEIRGQVSYSDDICGAITTVESWTRCKNECFEYGAYYGLSEATLRSNHLEAGFKAWGWRYNTPDAEVVAIYRDIIVEYAKAKAYLERQSGERKDARPEHKTTSEVL